MGSLVVPGARSFRPVFDPSRSTVLHSSGSPLRLKTQLISIVPHAAWPVLVRVNVMLGTSLFLPSAVTPASNQPLMVGSRRLDAFRSRLLHEVAASRASSRNARRVRIGAYSTRLDTGATGLFQIARRPSSLVLRPSSLLLVLPHLDTLE